jgi:phospholipase B1
MNQLQVLALFVALLSIVQGRTSAEFTQLVEGAKGKYASLKDEDAPLFAKLLLEHQSLMNLENRTQRIRAPVPFTCTTYPPSPQNPTSVHKLLPGDIKVVAALGDSLTAGFGAKSTSIFNIYTEYRGIAWSIGGDSTVSSVISVPNVLKKYNPSLTGFSLLTGTQTSANSNLNRAITGARTEALPDQANDLVAKIKANSKINLQEDWKVISILIGSNDLCDLCTDPNKYSPQNYQTLVRQSLRIIRDNIPRVFVNLMLGIDTTKLYEVTGGLCSLLHSFECSCATSDDAAVRAQVSQALIQYNELLIALRDEEEFNNREDFTIVIQPFLKNTEVPRGSNNKPDLDYFAPDCFHFSELSHEAAGVALWNNMIEPVQSKSDKWTLGEAIDCPAQGQYFYTNKNSGL